MIKNIVLIEPSCEFWSTIKMIWDSNKLKAPLSSFCGFIGNEVDPKRRDDYATWPKCIDLDPIDHARPYKSIHNKEHRANTRAKSVDKMVEETKITPDILNIDIEGAELLALKGARNTLKNNRMKVWVSIHSDLLEKNYGSKKRDVLEFMNSLGYKGEKLGVDHEQHYFFTNKL